MRWLPRSYDGGSRTQMTHNVRDKRSLEKPLFFPILPRVSPFASYDREVQVKNAYGPKAISGGTAYVKQDTGDVSKVPLMVYRESTVLSIFMKD